MDPTQFFYLPIALPLFLVFVAGFLVVFLLLPLKLMKYAYEQLGLSPTGAVLMLFARWSEAVSTFPLR